MLNAAQFSSAKEATKSKLMQGALRNSEGEMQSFSKFEKDASKIADIVNETWLRTEYESCRRQAIQGEQFRQLQEDKDLYPYWVYHGVMDDRERDEHVVLEGLVFKIGDPEGDACYPQNGWNCRCSAESVDDQYLEENKLKALTNEEAKGYLESDVDQQFRTNPAIQGTLPNTGSYFEVMGSANEGNAKLFNLPKAIDIPEAITKLEPITGLSIDEAKKVMADLLISNNERAAIKTYTESNYAQINAYLRGIRKTISEENEGVIKELSTFIESAPKVTAESFRGLTLDEYSFPEFKNLKKGEYFTDKAFMSSSYDKSIATKFGGSQYTVEMSIKGKNGVLIEGLSDAKAEKEIIFGKSSKFEIKDIKIKEKVGIYGKILLSLIEI
jgi:hypothetical protein